MFKSVKHPILSMLKSSAGLLLFFICAFAIYQKVLMNEDGKNIKQIFLHQLKIIPSSGWVCLLLLMLANLIIESIKWKLVVSKNNSIGILKSIKSVFVGQAFAFFTPNRIGEYAGRTLFLNAGNKLMGLSQMAWTSYAQLLVTITIGAIALFINITFYPWMTNTWMIWIKIGSPILALLALYLYFSDQNWKGVLSVLNSIQIAHPIKVQLLGWSLLRYLIFIIQYYLVAHLLQMNLSFLTVFLSLSILFLLLSILPTISITELVVRGQLLILILTPFYSNKLIIVSLSSIIWGINFLLPSMIGTFLLLGYRIKGNKA